MPLRRAERLLIRSRLVRRFLVHLSSRRADVARLARAQRLPADAATAEDVVLTLAELHDFFEAAARVGDDPLLGIHVAESVARGDHGLLEFVGRSAPDVRTALGMVGRYGKMLNEAITYSFEETTVDGVLEGALEESIPDLPACVGRHGNEYFVVGILTYLRQATGKACVPTRVWLAHDEPSDRQALARALGTDRIEVGRGANGIAFDLATLTLPLASHDRPLLEVLERQAAQAVAPLAVSVPLVAQLRALLRETLHEDPSLETIAAKLAMSPRTLQRRLDEVGSTYAAERELVREALARALVVDPLPSIDALATRLGYADLRGFLRAFKRWTGLTPKQFRARR